MLTHICRLSSLVTRAHSVRPKEVGFVCATGAAVVRVHIGGTETTLACGVASAAVALCWMTRAAVLQRRHRSHFMTLPARSSAVLLCCYLLEVNAQTWGQWRRNSMQFFYNCYKRQYSNKNSLFH